MATRSIVAITQDGADPVLLFRRWDGYPKGVQPALDQLCEWRRNGDIANYPAQAAGWLVLLGYQEEMRSRQFHAEVPGVKDRDGEVEGRPCHASDQNDRRAQEQRV